MTFNVNPNVLNDIQNMVERTTCQHLIRDLKQYRPHRRPITDVPKHLEKNPILRRKRRLIVRDWFYFAVWHLRLKKILNSIKDDRLSNFYFFDPKYQEIIHRLLEEKMSVEQVRTYLKLKQESLKMLWPLRQDYFLRVDSVKVNLYKDHFFDAQ